MVQNMFDPEEQKRCLDSGSRILVCGGDISKRHAASEQDMMLWDLEHDGHCAGDLVAFGKAGPYAFNDDEEIMSLFVQRAIGDVCMNKFGIITNPVKIALT